jgi:hypothetical protein
MAVRLVEESRRLHTAAFRTSDRLLRPEQATEKEDLR